MEKSPEYRQAKGKFDEAVILPQLETLMRRYDRNGDGKLSRGELEIIRSSVKLFFEAPPSDRLEARKGVLTPLLMEGFPPVDSLLRRYDLDKDGALDLSELKALVEDSKGAQ